MNKDVINGLLQKYNISKQTLLFVMGLIGIVFIALAPSLSFHARRPREVPVAQPTSEEYAKALEERLGQLLEEVEGVGKVKVMVTLQGGYSYVYAKEAKSNNDRMEDSRAAESKKTQEKNILEETYILVDGPSGKKPLITAQIEPEIRGVVVICQGGGSPVVAARVVETVKVALNISSAQIAVSQLAPG